MADFFDFNFNVVPDAQNFSPGSSSSPFEETKASPRKPTSFFFTDPESLLNQTVDMAFGPLGTREGSNINYSERKFQLTNIFKTKNNVNPEAYAVTKGILFIVPQVGSDDLVNVFLKPITPVDLGLKIKYYVYRSVKKANICNPGDFSKILEKDAEGSLPFLNKIWGEFQEFHELDDNDPDLVLYAEKLGVTDMDNDYASFFTKNKFTLPIVNMGEHIGFFHNEFGFEVVIDEGDFAQDKSDTGFEFMNDFFRAKKCVLDLDYNNEVAEYGNLPYLSTTTSEKMSEKTFRESIYLFLDPAAYYGSHVTDLNNGNKNGGIVKTKNTTEDKEFKTPEEIYYNIVNKFINKNRIYFYVKSNRNRSYKFYKNENERNFFYSTDVTKTPSSNWNPTSFLTNKWPIIIRSSFDEKQGVNFGTSVTNLASSNIEFEEVSISNNDTRINRNNILLQNLHEFKLTLPHIEESGTIKQNIGYFINICFLYEEVLENKDFYANLFGIINLKTIFEKEDFKSAKGSYVNHLRPILIKDGTDIGLYQTKLVLEGDYISSTNPPEIPPETTPEQLALLLSKNLRTYILFPQQPKSKDGKHSLTAGYYCEPQNGEEYCKAIYGEGEIWKGIIIDNSEPIKSLLYRRKDNDDGLPVYQLGISQNEYLALKNNAKIIDVPNNPNPINFFFDLEENATSVSPAFMKYELRLTFDKKDGTQGKTTLSKSLYTIDGYLFFTKEYSDNFESKYCKEFANIAVDFLPKDLLSANMGYECGFDFIGHEINSGNPLDRLNRNRYTDLVGTEVNGVFVVDKKRFLNLAANQYNGKPTNWRNTLDDFPFHTDSFITLFPKKETVVSLKFTKLNTSEGSGTLDKVFIRYNKKYVSIDNPTILPTVNDEYAEFIIHREKYQSNTINNFSIKIKSLQSTAIDIPLEVFYIKNGIKNLAGKCWLRKNNERYKIDIVIVNCKTNISGSKTKDGILPGHVSVIKKQLENFLGQILITPNLILTPDGKPIDLDLSNDPAFKTGGTYIHKTLTNTIISSPEMFDYCKSKIRDYQDQCILFYFIDPGISGTEKIAGEAQIKNDYIGGAYGARIFSDGEEYNTNLKNTSAHELLHSIGLYHSFDDNSKYTFEKLKTDNIMDYIPKNNPSDDAKRVLIWKWQDKKVKATSNNSKLIKE